MKHEKTTSLLSLLVTALFALCLLLTVLTGAKVYRKTVEKTEEAFDKRTKVQYLSTKVRQGRDVGVEDFADCRALALRETLDGECYVTYVYCYEGWLRELFCPEGAQLSPEDGEKVLEADTLVLSLENGLLRLEIDGDVLYLECRGGY